MNNGEPNQISKTAFPPWMQSLRKAVDAELKEGDLQEIVRAFIDKAKSGDDKAARFVLEYLMGGKLAPQNVTIHNHYDVNNHLVSQTLDVTDVEIRVRDYLEVAGQAKPHVIAADLELPVERVQAALRSDWFIGETNGYCLASSKRRRA